MRVVRRVLALAVLSCALTLGLTALEPASTRAAAPVIDGVVKDDKGKPVEDAVVYVAPGPATAGGGTLPATALMDQWKQEFIPNVLPVEAGTPVSFPNRDNIRHHVYSVSPAKKFELPLYIGTPTSPVVFDKAGPVVLGCNIHDWMLAYVYVLPTPHFAKTGADGKARLESVPPGSHEVRVWHPRLKVDTETTGQRVTVAGSAEVTFTIGLKREWRKPRPAGSRYDPSTQGN